MTPREQFITALAGGQLVFNRNLSKLVRALMVAILAVVFVYALFRQRDVVSNWIGVAAVVGTLIWLRIPKQRWTIVVLVVIALAIGFPIIYEFAGGEDEWAESGGSRLSLIGRVIEVTMRNPITGLGPAAYRPYARMEPLEYRGAYWSIPLVSSHNNYVDIFSHTGIIGLGIFLWFMVTVARLAWRLKDRFTTGFLSGYVNAMFATLVGSAVAMVLADWILPFIYNIGFPGFQASALVWLFLGGLITLDHLPDEAKVGVEVAH